MERSSHRLTRTGRGSGRAGSLKAWQALGGDPRQQIGGNQAEAHPDPGGARRGTTDRQSLLVAVEHLGGDVRPGEAPGSRMRCGGHPASAVPAIERERTQRLGQRERIAGRREHTVDPVAHDVAVAGDVRGDDGRAGSERLGEDHAEALAMQRRRAQHLGPGELGQLAGL